MGLSILIPVYNYNVTSLISSLAAQLTESGKSGEIILLDDGSANFISDNQLLESISLVSFYRNEKNEGRIAARKKLASLAKYNYLLFLDCDSAIIKDDFLDNYFTLSEMDNILISGGRVYTNEPPSDCELMLHWKYGTKREKNNSVSQSSFMSNNFLIKKDLFFRLDNSIQLQGYGHEDSWWGMQFEQMGVEWKCINNPVLHLSLEKAKIFLAKSENALANLLVLEKNIPVALLNNHIKIFRWYYKLKKSGFYKPYLFFERLFHQYFRKNLLSCTPSLFFFDCYRLAILIRMDKNNKSINQ